MTTQKHSSRPCAICGKTFPLRNLVSGELIRTELVAEICKTRPDWSPQMFICRPDLTAIRGAYVHDLHESERGELSSLEQGVVRSLQEHEIISSNVDAEFEEKWSLGERWADRLAAFGCS